MYTHVYTHVYGYVYTHAYTHVYTHVYIHTSTHAYSTVYRPHNWDPNSGITHPLTDIAPLISVVVTRVEQSTVLECLAAPIRDV